MINSRVSKRSGYGVHRGATNPKLTVNDTAPLNPKNKDLWLDTSSSPAVLKWYDASTTTWTT
jgi:hypothetical protein